MRSLKHWAAGSVTWAQRPVWGVSGRLDRFLWGSPVRGCQHLALRLVAGDQGTEARYEQWFGMGTFGHWESPSCLHVDPRAAHIGVLLGEIDGPGRCLNHQVNQESQSIFPPKPQKMNNHGCPRLQTKARRGFCSRLSDSYRLHVSEASPEAASGCVVGEWPGSWEGSSVAFCVLHVNPGLVRLCPLICGRSPKRNEGPPKPRIGHTPHE